MRKRQKLKSKSHEKIIRYTSVDNRRHRRPSPMRPLRPISVPSAALLRGQPAAPAAARETDAVPELRTGHDLQGRMATGTRLGARLHVPGMSVIKGGEPPRLSFISP